CLRYLKLDFYLMGHHELLSALSICNTFQTEQQKEPLMSHPVPNQPWEFIATDLFEHNGRDYLVTTDYFSNFCEIDRLYNFSDKILSPRNDLVRIRLTSFRD
ncbi:hypothetical protein QZH41_008059, partial [Actinostola sp. cb2023]